MESSDKNFVMSGSILKLLRHKSFIEQKKKPICSQVILTDVCNLKCNFCINRHGMKNTLPKEMAIKAIDALVSVGAKGIEFTGGGEPILHPDFEFILGHAINRGIQIALVTNGTKLKNVSLDILNKLEWIRISINAGRKNYKKIHGMDRYDDVISGVKKIENLSIKNKGISYIYSRDSEIEDIQNLLDDLQPYNIDYFRIAADVLSGTVYRVLKQLRSDKFPIINQTDRNTGLPKTCGIFYYKPVIDCDGTLYPCCINLYRKTMPIGRIEDIEFLAEKKIDVDPMKCPYCIYTDANNLIEDMGKQIKNENFV